MTIRAEPAKLPGRVMITTCVSALALQFTMARDAAAQSATAQPIPLMDRQREIALALSACPPTLAEKAGVYVLEAPGYVKVSESQNGFTAIVQHSVPGAQEPQCMDAEGARTILPRILKVAELRAQGRTPEEIRRFVADAFAKGIFQPPRRVGIDYMLSTENVVPDDDGFIAPFPPHLMFYAPFMTNAEVGSEGQAAVGPHSSPLKAPPTPSSSFPFLPRRSSRGQVITISDAREGAIKWNAWPSPMQAKLSLDRAAH